MIATNDIKTILYKAVKADATLGTIGIIKKDVHPPVVEGNVPERVVIVVNATDNSGWQKGYARMLVYVPDLKTEGMNPDYYVPDTARLTELERVCATVFKKKTLVTEGSDYLYYEIESMSQDPDPETWSHFINVRLKITNTNFN